MRLSSLKNLRLPALFLVHLVLIPALGCGPTVGTIKGKVVYKESELKAGYVSFTTENGKTTMAARIADDGTYIIEKMPVGNVKISVETKSLIKTAKGFKNEPPPGQSRPGGDGQTDESAKLAIPIPERYADPATSGLTYTVKAGSQEHNIKLE